MTDPVTPNLGLTKPTVNADQDSWGDIWNANADLIDAAAVASYASLLSQGVSTNLATLDIPLGGAHRKYRVELTEILPAVDGRALYMRASIDGGASFLAGSNYSYGGHISFSSGTGGDWQGQALSQLQLGGGQSADTSGYHSNYGLEIAAPPATGKNARILWEAGYSGPSFVDTHVVGTGRVLQTAQVTHLRFLYDTGAIAAVRWALYGLNGL